MSQWEAAGYSLQEEWAAAGWPHPLDPDTGKPVSGEKIWRMDRGKHPDGRDMADDDWFNPKTQWIFQYLRDAKKWESPLWTWSNQMQAKYPRWPVPGVNIDDLIAKLFPEGVEQVIQPPTTMAVAPPAKAVATPAPTTGKRPPVSPRLAAWQAFRGEARKLPVTQKTQAEEEAQRAAIRQMWLTPEQRAKLKARGVARAEVGPQITPVPPRREYIALSPEERAVMRAVPAVPVPTPPPPVRPTTREGPEAGLGPEERAALPVARPGELGMPIQFGALERTDISRLTKARQMIQGILSLPYNYYLRPLFQGLYELAKIPERGMLILAEAKARQPMIDMPGGDIFTSALQLSTQGLGMGEEYAQYQALMTEKEAEKEEPLTIESMKQAWELGYIGYSLLADPEKHDDAWQMIEQGQPISEIIKKHENVGLELLGNIIIDPAWLIPPAWAGKLLPVKEMLGVAGKELTKVPGINYLIDVTRAGRLKTYGYTISDAMDRFMLQTPADQSVAERLGRLLMGDEEALATLGRHDRQLLDYAASTFKRHDSTWQAVISKYTPEVLSGMPPAEKAAALARLDTSLKAMAERIISKVAPEEVDLVSKVLERDPRKIGRWLAEGLINLKRKELGLKVIQERGALYRGMSFAAQLWKESILPINIAFHQVNLLDSSVRMALRGYFWSPGDAPVVSRILQKLTGREPLEMRVAKELEQLGVTLPRELQTGLIRELLETEGYRLKTRYAYPKVPIPFIGKPEAVFDFFKKMTGNDLIVWAAEASTKGGLRGKLGKLIGAIRFADTEMPIADALRGGKGYEIVAKALNRLNFASLVEAGAENLNIEPLVRITTFWKEADPLFNLGRLDVAKWVEREIVARNPGAELIAKEIADQVRNPNVVQSVADLGKLLERYMAEAGPKLDAFTMSFTHGGTNKVVQDIAKRVSRLVPTTEADLTDLFAYGQHIAEENYSRVLSSIAPEQATVEQLRLAGAPEHLTDDIARRVADADAAIRVAYKRLGAAVRRIEVIRGSDLGFYDLGRSVSSRVNQEVWAPHYEWYNKEFWPAFQAKLDHATATHDSLEVSRLWDEFRATIGPKFVKVGESAAGLVDDIARDFLRDIPTEELAKALGVTADEITEAVPKVAEAIAPEVARPAGEVAREIETIEQRIAAIDKKIEDMWDEVYRSGSDIPPRTYRLTQEQKTLQARLAELQTAKPAEAIAPEVAPQSLVQRWRDAERAINEATDAAIARLPADLTPRQIVARTMNDPGIVAAENARKLIDKELRPLLVEVAEKAGLKGYKNLAVKSLIPKLDEEVPDWLGRIVLPEVARPVAEEAPGLVERILEQEAEKVKMEDASLLERAKGLRDETVEALREMQEQALLKYRTAREMAERVPGTLAGLDEIRPQAMRQMADSYENAVAQGISTVHELFYDYAARRGMDELLWWASPFTIWQTRNPFGWAKVISQRPVMVNVIRRTLELTEAERKERALPGRFDGTVPLPQPFVDGLIQAGILPRDVPKGTYLAADVSQFYSIWGQVPAIEGDLPWGWEEEPLVGKIVRSGEFIGMRTYPWWQIPLEKMGAYGSVPASDLTYANKFIRAVTRALGKEVDIEKPLREWRDRNEQNGIARYYANLRLLDYFFNDEITMVDLVEASSNPGNANFQKAYQESMDWQFRLALIRGLEPFTLKYATPAEQKARALQEQYYDLPISERAKFREDNPLLVAYWTIIRQPEYAEETRQRQRREQWSEGVGAISAAAMAKIPLGSKAYQDLSDSRRAILDGVEKLFPYEPSELVACGLRFEAQRYFELTGSFFDEEGGLKEGFSWDDYYAAKEAFMNKLVGDRGDPSPRLEFERYLAQNETPAVAILNAWVRLYGQSVWDVINEGGDSTEAKRKANQGRDDTQALLAEVLRIHPDWAGEKLGEARQAAKRLATWDAWARRNQPLRDALVSTLWSGYMGLDDLARKRFREFIEAEPDIDPRVAIIFEKIILPKEIEKGQEIWARDMGQVSTKTLLILVDRLGGVIDLEREGFQREIEQAEEEYELRPVEPVPGPPAEVTPTPTPEAKGKVPGLAKLAPETEAVPPTPPTTEPTPPTPPKYGERPFVPPTAGEEAEYDQARAEMQTWAESGKETDWTPLMEKWFGRDTPASGFWEFYWAEIPPGEVASDIRGNALIAFVLNPDYRKLLSDEAYNIGLGMLKTWREEHPEIPGDPKEWAVVRKIVAKYWELKDAGATNDASALWKYFSPLLEKYYPSRRTTTTQLPITPRPQARRGGGGAPAPAAATSWGWWRRWPKIRYYPRR